MDRIINLSWVLKIPFYLLVLLLAACSQDFSSEDDEERTASINEHGRELYNEQCSSCHGASGEGGSGGALIACATCGSEDSLIAKIERDMPSSSNPMHGDDASDVSEYIFAAFNQHATGKVQRSLVGVSTMSSKESVYKLAFELAGRLPTEEEVALFTGSLDGEKEVVYSFMNSDYFYERLKEMFNDTLLTDYAWRENTGSSGSAESLYSSFDKPFTVGQNSSYDVYPNYNWEADVGGMLSATYLDYFGDKAMVRRPLLLVEYLARNDRSFKEFVSGKYTVVNAFSFRALGGNTDSPNVRIVDPDQDLGNGGSAIVANPQWKEFSNVAEVEDYLDVIELYGNVNTNGDFYVLEDFPYDPRDMKAAQIYYNDEAGSPEASGIPHSGILTDEIFLHKYTATETNMHRNRARMVYWFFAAKDLLAIEGNRDAALLNFEDFGTNVGVSDPTNSNPDCIVCHEIMDVVAASFEHYSLDGVYDVRNPDQIPHHDDTIGWGLNSAQIQTTGSITNNYYSRELQWLGEQVAADPAYPRGIAQVVLKGMTGQEILGEPNVDSPVAYANAYSQQARLIANAAAEFAGADYNIKALVYAISKSAYYRSTGILFDSLEEEYSQIGSVRYLPPQVINQKLRAINSGGWNNSLNLTNLNSRMFMGGKNTIDVFEDADSVSGIISAVSERLAVEESCDIVRNEFNTGNRLDRKLFKFVDDSTDMAASTANARLSQMKAIRENIAYLYLAVLYQEVETDSEEVDIAFDLFLEALESDIDTPCNTGTNSAVREAWYAVMVFMLTDYRFIYS